MKRVVITGAGAVSACGVGVEPLWRAARDGVSGVGPIDFPSSPNQHVKTAGGLSVEVQAEIWKDARPRLQDLFTAMALSAARQAVAEAGLQPEHFGSSCGVIIGSGGGGLTTVDNNIVRFARDSLARIDPMGIPKTMTNAAASWVSMEYDARGVTMCISTACSSATQSIGLAAHMIRHGMLDRCIAGGSEAILAPTVFRSWELLRVMTPGLCRPFSEGRDGMILGDGSAVVVLESLESAQARGATIIAELAGYGTTSDGGGDLLRSDPKAAAACMSAAIADAGLSPGDIAYVNAHGTGTVANEQSETAALRAVFGAQVDHGLLVSSTKPIHGHAMGAAGAIELIVTIKALVEQVAPPTINFTGVDPKLGIDPVANFARPFSGDACMTNSFAFGGINATLVVKRYRAA